MHAPSSRRPRSLRPAGLAGAATLALALGACEDSTSASDACGRPLRLSVGEAVDVELDATCPLRAEGGSDYVLAYFDERFAVAARTQPEIFSDSRFVVIAADATDARAALAPQLAERIDPGVPPDHKLIADGTRPRKEIRAVPEGPWREGDVISLQEEGCPGCSPPPARVVRVVDGWLVLAVVDAEVGAELPRILPLFDQAVPLFREHALPMLRSSFTQERPVTTAASGQLVMILRGDVTGADGAATSAIDPGGTATHWIRLETSEKLDVSAMLDLVAHEVAHTFQYEFQARTEPLEGHRGARIGISWSIEGGATLIGIESLRRAAGLPLTGNVDFRAAPASALEQNLFARANPQGLVNLGYWSAASYLRSLVMQRMNRGEPLADALREVSRGAVEGWYGVGPNSRRPGLSRRMRERVPDWDPSESVLAWTLSGAADDRTSNPAFQDPLWLRLGEWEPTGPGWRPEIVVQAGSGASRSVTRPDGSAGYLLLRSTGEGVAVRVTAPPALRWRLLRVS